MVEEKEFSKLKFNFFPDKYLLIEISIYLYSRENWNKNYINQISYKNILMILIPRKNIFIISDKDKTEIKED